MNLLRNLLICALLLAAIAACGQKGPLFLPQDESGQTPAVTPLEDEDDDGA